MGQGREEDRVGFEFTAAHSCPAGTVWLTDGPALEGVLLSNYTLGLTWVLSSSPTGMARAAPGSTFSVTSTHGALGAPGPEPLLCRSPTGLSDQGWSLCETGSPCYRKRVWTAGFLQVFTGYAEVLHDA